MSQTPPIGALLVGGGVLGAVLLAALTLGGSPVSPASTPLPTPPAGRPGVYFTWAEFQKSGTASRLKLDNTPTPEAAARIKLLCKHVLDPLRHHLGRPIRITSGYRSKAVNKALKGASSTSQHMSGEAADFKVEGLTAVQIVAIIHRLRLPVDQAIWYDPERGGHVHISYTQRRANRGEYRHAPAGGGYPHWSPANA